MCELRALSDDLLQKAALELNEQPAEIAYYLNALRTWVQRQAHFRSRTSDQFLIIFLRAAKFSLEVAKQKLENFYTYRSMVPELFQNRNVNDPKVWKIIKSGCLLSLPQPVAADGPRVLMIRPNRFDLTQYTIPDVFKVGGMAGDIIISEDDQVIVAGYVIIMDLGNITKSVILNFDPNFAKKMTILANKITPTRMKGFHFLNVPPIFEKLFNMVKSVINEKLRTRFYVHGNNYESLYEHIPRHILPKEYGGDCDTTVVQDYWCQHLYDNQDFIKEEESYGLTNDGCKQSYTQLQLHQETHFGLQGSFRKLNID